MRSKHRGMVSRVSVDQLIAHDTRLSPLQLPVIRPEDANVPDDASDPLENDGAHSASPPSSGADSSDESRAGAGLEALGAQTKAAGEAHTKKAPTKIHKPIPIPAHTPAAPSGFDQPQHADGVNMMDPMMYMAALSAMNANAMNAAILQHALLANLNMLSAAPTQSAQPLEVTQFHQNTPMANPEEYAPPQGETRKRRAATELQWHGRVHKSYSLATKRRSEA